MAASYLVRNFLRYTVLFKEGAHGETAYLLQEGRIELSKEVAGRKKVLAVLSPISMFGEMALFLEDSRRTATAVALDDVRVVEIKKDDFEQFVQQSPQIMRTLLDVLVHRLKSATTKVMRVPSVYHGTCQIIALCARNGLRELDYMYTVRAIAHSFLVTDEQAETHLATLKNLKLIEHYSDDYGNKRIRILEAKDFVNKAVERLRQQRDDSRDISANELWQAVQL